MPPLAPPRQPPHALPRRADTGPNPNPRNPNPGDDDGDGGDDHTASNLVNMYFLILALFVVLLLCTLWYWRRNKRSKALASLGVRRTALVADLEMRRQRGPDGGGGGGGGDAGEDEAPPPPYVTRPERVRGGLPKYEEVVAGDGGVEVVVRERRDSGGGGGGGGLGSGAPGGGRGGGGGTEGESAVSVAVPPAVH